MAKRAKIKLKSDDETKELDGYLVSDDIGLVNSDAGWIAIHIRTGSKLVGGQGPWKQKRQALAFAEYLVDAGVNWDFDTQDEMFKLNGVSELREIYREACEEGVKA